VTDASGGIASAPITVVLNLSAGHGNEQKTRHEIEDALAPCGREYRVLPVRNPDEMQTVARRIVEEGALQILVAAGGDGTANAVASIAIRGGLPFGVIPLGTFNYFARDLGIPLEPAAAAHAIAHGRVRQTDVAFVNGHLFLNNASFGLYEELIEHREQSEQRWGRYRIIALVSGTAALLKWHRIYEVQLELDGRNVVLRTPMIFFANNPLQLENLELDDLACAASEGQLGVLVLRPMSRPQLLGLAWRGAVKGLRNSENLRYFCASKIEVRRRGRRKRIKVAVDGESVSCGLPLHVEVARGALQVVIPCDPVARK
jgi:diacylglycerol kinase family enzyme